MKPSRLALGLAVSAFALLQGCSSTDDGPAPHSSDDDAFKERVPVTFVQGSVNADHAFSNAVDATAEDKLVVPTAGNDAILAKLTPGTILAGDRAQASVNSTDVAASKNPFGFLRKVTGSRQDGANTVIETQPATLDEWIENGDIVYSDSTSLFSTEATQIGTRTLEIQSDSGGGTGSGSATLAGDIEGEEVSGPNFKIKPKISLSNGTLQVNAKYDGYFKVRTFIGIPRKVELKSLLTVDPVIGTDLTVGAQVVGSESGLHLGTTPGITIAEKSFDMPGVVIPIAAPIPITVRFHPRLKCSLAGNGSATATVRAELRAHAAVGFEASASLGGIDSKDLSESPTLNPTLQFKGGQIKATISAECEIVAVPEVLAFDAVGLSGEVGPYMDLNLDGCLNLNEQTQSVDGGFTLSEEHGLQLQFSARAQLPVVGIGKDFPLLTVHTAKSDPKYLVGDKQTCELKTKDSCDGRTDGFYCSVVDTFAGIYCKDGQVEKGLQCADKKQRCVGGTEDAVRCN